MVVPIAPQAATIFYDKLFAHDPSLRYLFKEDLTEQKAHLIQTLDVAVRSLTNLDELVPVLERLGQRHVIYGVRDEHYATVGAALLETLAVGLDDAFTPQVKEAWGAVYGVMADVMKKAAAKMATETVAVS